MKRLKFACVGIAVALLAVGCASSKDNAGTANGPTTTAAPSATGPAPGVTDDAVKIGITYVDASFLKKVNLNYNLGDWKAAAQAQIDEINAAGGINGRKLVPVYAPIDPTGTASADAACVKLTEDDKVFLVTGFFLNDAAVCPVSTHKTAVVGGMMNPERLAKAQAPWATWEPDTGQTVDVVNALAKKGALAGKVAVFAGAGDAAAMNDDVIPALKAAGITPVASAVMDAPVSDTAAIQNKVNLIAQNFQAKGADTVLIVGIEGANWPTYMKSNPYRPKLRFTETTAPLSFVTNASTTDADLVIMEGALEGGVYGPDQAVYDEAGMQACIKTLTAAGVKVPSPALSKPGDPSDVPYQAAFRTCPAIALTKAVLQAAGRNLNYGTLATAMNGLKVKIPGDPTERTYGPPPAADGNPVPYIFAWDAAKKNFVLDQG